MRRLKTITLLAAAITLMSSSCFTADCRAAAEPAAIDGMAYNVQFSLPENLKSFVGKKITLTLTSGSSFTGRVRQVGQHLVHLERLDGRDFYDALIRIDAIVAVDARFWEVKR